jgi:hypothetical protein
MVTTNNPQPTWDGRASGRQMDEFSVRALVAAEHADALAGLNASVLAQERSRAMEYYLQDMMRDMPTTEGRSAAVSSDVADTIEGLMPSLMEIFAGGDEVVRFEPVGPEDEGRAAQETDYINWVFMQQNPGFMVLYMFIKDCLLSKNSFVKVFWEHTTRDEKETYYDLTDDTFAMIADDPDVEIVAHTVKSQPGELPGQTSQPIAPPGGNPG